MVMEYGVMAESIGGERKGGWKWIVNDGVRLPAREKLRRGKMNHPILLGRNNHESQGSMFVHVH